MARGAHLRELLMACGLLPAVDKQILLFERWLHEYLTEVNEPDHAQVLRRFATWHVLHRLRARADTRPLTPAGRRYAGEQILQATAFHAWLAGHGRTLADCTQADVDTWHVERTASDRANIRPFLLWSAKTRLTRRFALPTTARRGDTPLPERDRAALLGQVLTDRPSSHRSAKVLTDRPSSHRPARPAAQPGRRVDPAARRPTSQPGHPLHHRRRHPRR